MSDDRISHGQALRHDDHPLQNRETVSLVGIVGELLWPEGWDLENLLDRLIAERRQW